MEGSIFDLSEKLSNSSMRVPKVEEIESVSPSDVRKINAGAESKPVSVSSGGNASSIGVKGAQAVNTSAASASNTNTSTSSTHGSNNSIILKSVAIGLAVIVIIAAIVFIVYKLKNNKSKEIETLIKGKDDEIEKYKENIKRTNVEYEDAITELASVRREYKASQDKIRQLEESIKASKKKDDSMRVMKENSYDVSDIKGDEIRERVLKDKKDIQNLVNSKRKTLQDELDEMKVEDTDTTENELKSQLREMTNTGGADDEVESIGESTSEDEQVVEQQEAFEPPVEKTTKQRTSSKKGKGKVIATDETSVEVDNLLSIIGGSK